MLCRPPLALLHLVVVFLFLVCRLSQTNLHKARDAQGNSDEAVVDEARKELEKVLRKRNKMMRGVM